MLKPRKLTITYWYWAMALAFFVLIPCSVLRAAEQMPKDENKEMAQVRQEADETLQAIKDYSIDKKEQVMAKSKEEKGDGIIF